MSDTGSPRTALVPVAPQGHMEMVASTSGAEARPTYEELLRFYVEKTKWPVQQTPPPLMLYGDLALFAQVHGGPGPERRPPTPLPQAPPLLPLPSTENVDEFLTEDEVVTKDEAREAFATVKEGFVAVGEEQGRMKEGLQGLASKLDEVQGKAAEDMRKLAEAADTALSQTSSVASDLSDRVAEAERLQAAAQAAAARAQATGDAALQETATARRDQQIAHAQLQADVQTAALQSATVMERAAAQAAQAMTDARSARVSVPRLESLVGTLQAELQVMKVASQQSQERTLRMEHELSTAQDRIGAAERRATKAEHDMLRCKNGWTIGMHSIRAP